MTILSRARLNYIEGGPTSPEVRDLIDTARAYHEAQVEIERLDRDGRAVAGRCLHYEARTAQAEDEIARLRAGIEWAMGVLPGCGTTPCPHRGCVGYRRLESVLDGKDAR